jgi:lysophospholipase L1-like esterase
MRARFGAIGCVAALAVTSWLSGCIVPDSYVALGDSYTAGPLIPNQDANYPGCLRSDHNYPHLIAPDLGLPAFRDVSCSGAQTKDMTSSQDVDPNPDNPPQFNALNGNTKVVTLGIGGNDIGFTGIAEQCAELYFQNPTTTGSPCKDFYNQGGTDQLAVRIADLAPKLKAVLDGIDARSPNAKVFVVGYPAILPETIGEFTPLCQLALPVAKGDVPYLRDGVEKRLNAMIQDVAVAHGEVYVDTYAPSIGHDACKLPTVRWVEPVAPGGVAAPVHPNADGMVATAETVRTVMRANGVSVG